MEVLGVVFAGVFLYAMYHVVRVAVREGVREALEDRGSVTVVEQESQG